MEFGILSPPALMALSCSTRFKVRAELPIVGKLDQAGVVSRSETPETSLGMVVMMFLPSTRAATLLFIPPQDLDLEIDVKLVLVSKTTLKVLFREQLGYWRLLSATGNGMVESSYLDFLDGSFYFRIFNRVLEK